MITTSRRGFAMIAALALLVLVSVAALELSVTARPRRLAVAAGAERIAATAAATAGVEKARALLMRLEPVAPGRLTRDPSLKPDPWAVANGMVIGPGTAGAYSYRVELHDPYAQLNLNGASQDQLRRLLVALRIDARRADHLAAAIADWRDHDQFRRVNGAERDDYLRAGMPVLPTDGPFPTVGTLRFVLGMSDALCDSVAPYLTVMGDGGINLNAAPRPVLLALPGMSEEAVALLLRARSGGRRMTDLNAFTQSLSSSARQQLRVAMPLLRNIATLETREMVVSSEAWQPAGVTRVRVDALISRDAGHRVTWRRTSP
jgi:general secretion pathway protein K